MVLEIIKTELKYGLRYEKLRHTDLHSLKAANYVYIRPDNFAFCCSVQISACCIEDLYLVVMQLSQLHGF